MDLVIVIQAICWLRHLVLQTEFGAHGESQLWLQVPLLCI